MVSLLTLLFLLSALLPASPQDVTPPAPPLHVAFHAQAPPSATLIVGSILTTTGLDSTLPLTTATASGTTTAISFNRTFYPSHYNSFVLPCPSLLIIEGYFLSLPSTIHEFRRANPANIHHGTCPPTIIFWSLDPDFPSVDSIAGFDVDVIATNSVILKDVLVRREGVPVAYIPLAADPMVFKPKQEAPQEPSVVADSEEGRFITFVGSAGGIISGSKQVSLERRGECRAVVKGDGDEHLCEKCVRGPLQSA